MLLGLLAYFPVYAAASSLLHTFVSGGWTVAYRRIAGHAAAEPEGRRSVKEDPPAGGVSREGLPEGG